MRIPYHIYALATAIGFFLAPVGFAIEDTLAPNLCPRPVNLEVHSHQYTDSGDVLFWFDNAIANSGKGALHILFGDTVSLDPDSILAIQFIKVETPDIDGPGDNWYDTIGVFVFDTNPSHNHWHLNGFAKYRILEDNNGTPDTAVRTGPKLGFCLVDHTKLDTSQCFCCGPLEGTAPANAVYVQGNCDTTSNQGISVGWYDLYNMGLEGQYLDVTGLDNGVYWLQTIVDPDNVMNQTDQTDDTARIKIQIITEFDSYEPNNSKAETDARPLGGEFSSNLVPCTYPITIDSLSIHQNWDSSSLAFEPDEDWFKFVLSETGGSGHYARIDFDSLLVSVGNIEMQLRNAADSVLETRETVSDSEFISLNGRSAGWYYVRIYPAEKLHDPPNSRYQINWNYSLELSAPTEVSGDVTCNGTVTSADVIAFGAYCTSGTPFSCPFNADVNGVCGIDCNATTGDRGYLIKYVFQGGDPPVCGCE